MSRSKKFDIERIASNTGLSLNDFQRSRVSVDTLKEIYTDYLSNHSMLDELQLEIMQSLNKNIMPLCHSIRSRIKDADHLIAKIVRNAERKGGKYLDINQENYLCRINDLIGIRIMVLRQRDFIKVHEAILSLFENDPNKYVSPQGSYDENISKFNGIYIAEKPIAYVTSEGDKSILNNIKCLDIATSKELYRSIHYIIRKNDIFFEIQVRTLFEEGWLEFDHTIKYPYDIDNPQKIAFLRILNYLAVSADELITFYDTLEPLMNKRKASSNLNTTAIDITTATDSRESADGKDLEEKLLALF